MGNVMFYGGLMGMIVCVLVGLLVLPIYQKQRYNLRKKIERGENE